MPVKFTEEFTRDAVALVASGIAQKTVCADLDVYPRTSRRPSTTPSTAKSHRTQAESTSETEQLYEYFAA